jgi:arsenate reductase (thioredoxin)
MKRVLFVCTGNRARSQMGEGLLRHIAGDRFDVHSAGTLPSGMSELTIEAMREIGIDVSRQWSKHIDDFDGQAFDYVITVCDTAKESCPVFPGGEALHWSIEDPSDIHARGVSLMDAFRVARDELRKRIETFAAER